MNTIFNRCYIYTIKFLQIRTLSFGRHIDAPSLKPLPPFLLSQEPINNAYLCYLLLNNSTAHFTKNIFSIFICVVICVKYIELKIYRTKCVQNVRLYILNVFLPNYIKNYPEIKVFSYKNGLEIFRLPKKLIFRYRFLAKQKL